MVTSHLCSLVDIAKRSSLDYCPYNNTRQRTLALVDILVITVTSRFNILKTCEFTSVFTQESVLLCSKPARKAFLNWHICKLTCAFILEIARSFANIATRGVLRLQTYGDTNVCTLGTDLSCVKRVVKTSVDLLLSANMNSLIPDNAIDFSRANPATRLLRRHQVWLRMSKRIQAGSRKPENQQS